MNYNRRRQNQVKANPHSIRISNISKLSSLLLTWPVLQHLGLQSPICCEKKRYSVEHSMSFFKSRVDVDCFYEAIGYYLFRRTCS